MNRRSYPDDLTNQEWEEIQDLATEQLKGDTFQCRKGVTFRCRLTA